MPHLLNFYFNADHPRYIEANTVCTMFDIQSGPDSIPVSRFSFDAKVELFQIFHSVCSIYATANNIVVCRSLNVTGG